MQIAFGSQQMKASRRAARARQAPTARPAIMTSSTDWRLYESRKQITISE